MLRYLIILMTLGLACAQSSRADIFVETEDPVDPDRTLFPNYIIQGEFGYLFHENNDFLETSYKDRPHASLSISKYVLPSTYLVLSGTYSTTELKIQRDRYNYNYISWYLGVRFFNVEEREFKDPWFFGMSFGTNEFLGPVNSFDRFSMKFVVGKVVQELPIGGRLYMSGALLLHEDLGVRDFYENPYLPPTQDYVLYASLQLSFGITFTVGQI